MSEENANLIATNTQEATASPEDLALQALTEAENAPEAQEGEEAENTEQTTKEAEKPANEAEAASEEDKTSKTQLWSRITQQDKTIRDLKQQMKTATSLDSVKEMARKDPAKFLESIGFGVDQVLDVIAGQQGQPATQQKPEENSEVSVLKKEIAEMRRYFDEQKQISMVTSEISHIDAAVKANPEKYEAIAAMKSEGSYNLVIEVASELYKQTGTIPEYDYVLESVEQHLEEELRAKYEKLSGLKKLQKQQAAPAIQSKPAGKSAPVINSNRASGVPTDLDEEGLIAYAASLLDEKKA